MKGNKERITEAGLDDHISKPIHVVDIIKKHINI